MQDTKRPESFFRRLLWNNSGVLCLATLITLPIILGVAIGYLIVLAFVTSYQKITGKKSREEKESEAAKKIRIVLAQDLLDTAFTKPEELPGQKPKFLRPLQRCGSASDAILSSDESESESELETEDESIEPNDERNLTGDRIEKDDFQRKTEVCGAVDVAEHARSQITSQLNYVDDDAHSGVTTDVIGSDVIDYNSPRTASASSGRYSTASEMVESDGRDSCGNDTPALDTHNYADPEENTQDYNTHSHKILAQNSCGHEISGKSVPDAGKTRINESGFFEENTIVNSMELVNIHKNETTAPAKHSIILDVGHNAANTPSTCESSAATVKCPTAQSDYSRQTTISSHHIEIPPSLGKLKYSVCYMQEKNELQVSIIKAIDLFHEISDSPPSSFVKVSLLPQRFCWQKTKIIQATINPVFNETFVISGFSHERFSNYTLLISVVNAVTPRVGFYGDHVIGEVYVPLSYVARYSFSQEKVFCQWADLKPKIAELANGTKCGKINLALCYRPISGRLIVTVKKGKELECESKEKFDPYVKLALYCGGSRVGRATTRVKRKVTNPAFNEKFNFDLNADRIAYTTIVVKVMNSIDSTKSSCAGVTILGYESSGNGQEHWLCMMKCLSKHVDAWHTLYT